MLKKFVIVFFWFGFCWMLVVPCIVLNGYTGYPKLQEHEILLMWLPPLVFFLPMLCLSLKRSVFEILSGFCGLFFKRERKEEENFKETSIKAKETKSFSGDVSTLFIAAHRGLPDVLNALMLSEKVDINATSSRGVTALILAIHKGHTEIVRLLLAAKADVNVTICIKGKTYTLLSMISEWHKEIISLLKENGATADPRVTQG